MKAYGERMCQYCAVTDDAVMFIRRRCQRAQLICERRDDTLDSLQHLGRKTARLVQNKITSYAFLSTLAQGNMRFYRKREDAYNCLSAKSHRLFLAMARQKVAQAWLARVIVAIEANAARLFGNFLELREIGRRAVQHQIKQDVACRALKVCPCLPQSVC